MDLVQFLDMALSTDMIVIYGLIFFMAILLIIIFSIDAKNKKRSLDESQIVIQGTVPLEEFKVANHLEEKIEKKIKELEETAKEEKVVEEKVENKEEVTLTTIEPKEVEDKKEDIKEELETIEDELQELVEENKEEAKEDHIQYEKEKTEEEKQEEAKEKLNEVAMSLIDNPEDEAVELTNFEIEQEENAIISYNELVKVSDDLYEQNEITQYADEGNEPITLAQLRMKFEDQESDRKAEVVHEESASSLISAIDALIQDETPKVEVVEEKPKVKLNDFIVVEDKKQEAFDTNKETKFQASPIISPIYGIEKEIDIKKQTELELEQTADLEKLDAELRKTNQFLQLLKELQKKLD